MNSQIFYQNRFQKKIDFCETILYEQPNQENIKDFLPLRFKIDSIIENEYHIKDNTGKNIIVFLHIETKEIVYIEFYEPNENFSEIKKYLMEEKNYEWPISEHNCDYLHNDKLLLTLCPGMRPGVMIQVSKKKL